MTYNSPLPSQRAGININHLIIVVLLLHHFFELNLQPRQGYHQSGVVGLATPLCPRPLTFARHTPVHWQYSARAMVCDLGAAEFISLCRVDNGIDKTWSI